MTKKHKFVPPTHDEIAIYAYYLWEADGRQSGRDMDYWLQAKAHLTADRQYEAGLLAKSEPTPASKSEPVAEPALAAISPEKPAKRRKATRPANSEDVAVFA